MDSETVFSESSLPTLPLMLNHSGARLSSSPASSPRIVESPPIRKKSVHPELSSLMDQRAAPGADFFDDSSEDNSACEDENGTRNFSEVEGLGVENMLLTDTPIKEEETRGRLHSSVALDALPPFNQIPTHDSGTATTNDEQLEDQDTKRAREMSLRRFGSVRIVHNRGSASASRNTARESMVSNDSGDAPVADPPQATGQLRGGHSDAKQTVPHLNGRHRRNTSASESIRADSILNAHVITMQALEALSPDVLSRPNNHSQHRAHHPRNSLTYAKPRYLTSDRHHVVFPPLKFHPRSIDPDRPAHLPTHFVKTPYPKVHKEFPKPKTHSRQHNLTHTQTNGIVNGDNESGYDDKKGRHVLGLVPSKGEYDLRSRLERNADADGVVKPSELRTDDTVVWLSLRRRRNAEVVNRLEQIAIPSSLTATSPDRAGRKIPHREKDGPVDFDDMYFAQQLREAYKKLTGSWLRRALSARKLRYIRLADVYVWSGGSSNGVGRGCDGGITHTSSTILAARDGIDTTPDAQSPFTEHNLMHLYRNPRVGKARYTWVHWAQRLAAANAAMSSPPHSPQSPPPSRDYAHRRASEESTSSASAYLPNSVSTIEFAHAFAPGRIALVLALVLALCLGAALAWLFAGESGWAFPSEGRGRAERVGSAMGLGVLVLLIEGVLGVVWVGASWVWG